MSLILKEETRQVESGYRYSEIEVAVPPHDADITLCFPNGKKVGLQWRVENGSLDVCLPEESMLVTCWQGYDMDSAPAHPSFSDGHVRRCGQLVIDLGPGYLEPAEIG